MYFESFFWQYKTYHFRIIWNCQLFYGLRKVSFSIWYLFKNWLLNFKLPKHLDGLPFVGLLCKFPKRIIIFLDHCVSLALMPPQQSQDVYIPVLTNRIECIRAFSWWYCTLTMLEIYLYRNKINKAQY